MAVKGRKVRIGIIGCGGIANSHIKCYKLCDDVEIVAGADIVPGKAKAFFERNEVENVKCYDSHIDMLNDESLQLDGVSICTYHTQHKVCTVDALKRGINVLLEKPMCVTMDEAIEMVKAEKESGKILSIGFQPRFDDNMLLVKKILQSGVLGKIYYIQTGGGRRRGIPVTKEKTTFVTNETAGIGALGDIGCYALDVVLNALNYPKPLTITGITTNYFGKDPNYQRYQEQKAPELADVFEVDDFAAGFVRMENDITLDFRISWAMNMDTPGDTIVLGTKAGLRIPSTDCWNGSLDKPLKLYHELEGEQIETEIPIKKNHTWCFEGKIRSFVDAIKDDLPAPIPTSQIVYNQMILSLIKESAQRGEEIKVNYPELDKLLGR